MALRTSSDTDALKNVVIEFNIPNGKGDFVRQDVKLQFAPKVTSDNRRGNWDEREIWGVEPLAIYKGSSARNITLQLTYINDGDQWTCSTIREQVNLIRGYYMRAAGAGVQGKAMVIRLKLWCIGGKDLMTFRMRSCDVKYSETMVTDSTPTLIGLYNYFPLRTDITLDLASWTQKQEVEFARLAQNAPAVPGLPGQDQQPQNDTSIQNVRSLVDRMPQDWY